MVKATGSAYCSSGAGRLLRGDELTKGEYSQGGQESQEDVEYNCRMGLLDSNSIGLSRSLKLP
jgi:hypothetical protein